MSFSAGGDGARSRDSQVIEDAGSDRRAPARLRGSGEKYVAADFGAPPYAPDGPVPRLYAPDRHTAGRRGGALATGLTVILAVLLAGGVTVTMITSYLRTIPVARTEPPTPAPHESRTGKPLSHEEFGDRNLGRTPAAVKVGGWDHPTCEPVDGKGRVLAKNRCRRAAQLAYTARGGKLKAVQLLLAFPTERRARAAAVSLSKRSSDALRWRKGGTHARYAYGKAGAAGAGPYVVVTVVTATGRAGGQGAAFHRALHADTLHRFAGPRAPLYGS